MPEGHALHRLARDLSSAFSGTQPRATSPQGRFADGAAVLDGHELLGASAWGKHLFVEWEGERVLHVHVGLIGWWHIHPVPEGADPATVGGTGAVRLRLETERHVADLRGPNLCELVDPSVIDTVGARLGPDPLRPEPDAERAWARITKSRKPIAELLMDQTVIAGIGNLYRSEILFRTRIDPHTPGNRLSRRAFNAIWAETMRLMPVGLAMGQIVTRDELLAQVEPVIANGVQPEPVPRDFYVYKRPGEACHVCGAHVRTEVAAGRNLFWCPRCQRRH